MPGSTQLSKSRFDLVQMLLPVAGAHRVERTGVIQARKNFIRQRGHELIGLFRNADRELSQSPWSDSKDQRSRCVVDPVNIRGLVLGCRDLLATLELRGEVKRAAVPERDVAQHSSRAPVFVDHSAELPVAQTRNQCPHARQLSRVRRHEGAIHDG